jgi:hypothetical protein
VILSVPHSAVMVAPGIVCPPERTTPVCTSAAAIPAKISKAMHEDLNIEKFPFIWIKYMGSGEENRYPLATFYKFVPVFSIIYNHTRRGPRVRLSAFSYQRSA